MNKVVIMFFVMVVGAVLIGVPLWGFFHPTIMPEYDALQAQQQVNAASNEGDLSANYTNTVWTVSHNLNIDNGYGQMLPAVFDVELHFQPGEKMICKSHLFSDTPLPAHYEALKATLEMGWEGKWRVKGGTFMSIESNNVFRGYNELDALSPFKMQNFKIEGDTLVYSPNGSDYYAFKRF